MFHYRAAGCSRGFLFAFLTSALIHLWLIANIAFQLPLEEVNSGIAQKNLQVLVKGPGEGRRDPVLAKPKELPPPLLRDDRTIIESSQGQMLPPIIKEESAIPSGVPAERVESVGKSVEVASAGIPATVRAMNTAESVSARNAGEELRNYRIALASTARKFKEYPAMARERGIGGRSEVVVVLVPAGMPQVSLRGSSGEPALDLAALEMVRRAVQVVELPPGLRTRQMELMLPVEFVPGS